MKININDLWEKEWKNAYNFFNSKGNINTRSRLKDRWNKEFKEMLYSTEREIIKQVQQGKLIRPTQ